jgi:hypothetical protein
LWWNQIVLNSISMCAPCVTDVNVGDELISFLRLVGEQLSCPLITGVGFGLQ